MNAPGGSKTASPWRRVRQPGVAVAIALAETLTVIEYFAIPDRTMITVAASIVQLALTAGLYWSVVPCSVGILALSVAAGLIPGIYFSSMLWPTWLVLGLLAYHGHVPLAIVVTLIDMFVRYYDIQFHGNAQWDIGGLATVLCTRIAAIAIGLAIAERKHRDQLQHEISEKQRLQEEQDRLRRNLVLASKLHDSTARGLTLIMLYTGEASEQHEANLNERFLSSIRTTAQSTLNDVRKIIDLLEDSDTVSASTSINEISKYSNCYGTLNNLLHNLVQDNSQYLSSVHLTGENHIIEEQNISLENIPPEIIQEITDLINQIYANILTYSARNDNSYYLFVSIHDKHIEITQFNEIQFDHKISHKGKGLRLHKQRISHIGGTLVTTREEGLWSLHATIPLSDS